MKTNVKTIALLLVFVIVSITLSACGNLSKPTPEGTQADKRNTKAIADALSNSQPTPTDISFSLERYNLTRRAYWVNGQREKAAALVCRVTKPLGYIVLFTESGNTVGRFIVDGKVSSLNSYLTPDSDYYEIATGSSVTYRNNWLADVDGSYGENDKGIFFFTPDGKYIEWTGAYLYSDIPFEVSDTVLTYNSEG